MENKHNMYVAVAYKLMADENGETVVIEEATAEKPFQFISGFGITLDAFENQMMALEQGGTFDFTLTKDEAYGDVESERILDLDRSVFSINGHFDHEHIFKDAIVPLQNEDGNRFYGKVLDVTDTNVKIDLNHPLAGKALHFVGSVVEKREATNSEIQGLINRLSGEGCGCGCGDCGGGCGDGDCDCGDHHHHDSGCGCGHCH